MLGKEKMTNNRQLQASMNDWIDEVIDGENEGVFVTLNFTQKKLGKTAIKATITHEEAAKIIKAFCRKIDGLFFSKRAIDKQEVLQVGLKRICFYEDGKFGNLHWHSLLFANRAELLAMRAKLLWQNMDKLKKLDVGRSRFDVLRTATDIKKVAYYCINDVRKNGLQNFDMANTRLAEKLAVA